MTAKPYILVVEDEKEIATMIVYNLEKAGFMALAIDDGEAALDSIAEKRPDVVLLDWMLPSLSGVEICQRLRNSDYGVDVPVIMLTARGEEADKIRGLDSGADDYMVKPFSPKELIARIKAIMRRAKPSLSHKTIEYAGIKVDMAGHKASCGGKILHLGPTEYRLLVHFIEKPGKVFSREQLLDNVWGRDVYVESRTVDVHIVRLRKALDEAVPGMGGIIKTIRSAGYIMEKE